MQEYRYHYNELELKYCDTGNGRTFILVSGWKISINASIGGVGMLLNLHVLKSLNSIEGTSLRIMCATFNGNPRTTVVSCYSPTNTNDE